MNVNNSNRLGDTSDVDRHLVPPFVYHELFRTRLETDALPEMLYKIYRYRVPGIAEFRRGNQIKKLQFRDGDVIYATSSHRGDSLWAFLLRQSLLPLELLRKVGFERATTNRRFGVLLLEQGLMSPDQLHQAIRGQIEQVVWSLFDWSDGDVVFEFGEPSQENPVQIRLPIPRLIMDGIRLAADPSRWLERLGGDDMVLEVKAGLERLIELAIGAPEHALLELVDGRRRVGELAQLGPLSTPENARLLYSLFVLRLVGPRGALS